jgi:hypothetical protein
MPPIYATCPTHLIFLDLVILAMGGELPQETGEHTKVCDESDSSYCIKIWHEFLRMFVFPLQQTELLQCCIRHTADVTSFCSLAFRIGIHPRDGNYQPSELNHATSLTDRQYTTQNIKPFLQTPASPFRSDVMLQLLPSREPYIANLKVN